MEYYLFLVTDDKKVDNYFFNKHMVFRDSLEEIDRFTSVYRDAQDLGDDINVSGQSRRFVDAVIMSSDNLSYMMNHFARFPKKEEKVLFYDNSEFIHNMSSNSVYGDVLIDEYKRFLLNHRKEISTSLVRYVKMGWTIDDSILDWMLERVFYAYYKNRTYKKIRDTYIDLLVKKKRYKRGC